MRHLGLCLRVRASLCTAAFARTPTQALVDDVLRLTKLAADVPDRFTLIEVKASLGTHLEAFINAQRSVVSDKAPTTVEHMNLLTQTRIPLQQLQNGEVVQVCACRGLLDAAGKGVLAVRHCCCIASTSTVIHVARVPRPRTHCLEP
jgi:hypothetical protein